MWAASILYGVTGELLSSKSSFPARQIQYPVNVGVCAEAGARRAQPSGRVSRARWGAEGMERVSVRAKDDGGVDDRIGPTQPPSSPIVSTQTQQCQHCVALFSNHACN